VVLKIEYIKRRGAGILLLPAIIVQITHHTIIFINVKRPGTLIRMAK